MALTPLYTEPFTGTGGASLLTITQWTKHPAAAFSTASDAVFIASGDRLRPASFGGSNLWAAYRNDVAVAADVFHTERIYIAATPGANDFAGVCVRVDSTADTMYYASRTNTTWQINKRVAGAASNVAVTPAGAVVVGESYDVTLFAFGRAITLMARRVSTGEIVGYLTVDDNSITAAGRVGIIMGANVAPTDANGIQFDSASAYAQPAVTDAVNAVNIKWSGSWNVSGSSFAKTTARGQYGKTKLRAGTTFASLAIDGTMYSSASGALVGVQVGYGPFFDTVVALGTSMIPIYSGPALAVDTEVRWEVVQFNSAYDRYNTPVACVSITGLVQDSGSSLLAPTILAKTGLFEGDSITEAFNAGHVTETVGDPRRTFVRLIADMLGIEWDQRGYTQIGVGHVGQGNIPVWPTMLDNLYSGVAKPIVGADYVFINIGQNDTTFGTSDPATQSGYQTALSRLRVRNPSARIYVIIPFSGAKRAPILAAVSAVADANTRVYDPQSDVWYSNTVSARTYESTEGIHPVETLGHGRRAMAMAMWAVRDIASIELTPANVKSGVLLPDGVTSGTYSGGGGGSGSNSSQYSPTALSR